MTTKTCTKCGETKTTDQFTKDNSKRDGLRSNCKTCIAPRNRAYKEANRDKIAAQQCAYREANRDRRNAQKRAYREANREECNAKCRAWYALVGDPGRERCQDVTARYATRNRAPWTPEEDRYLLTGPGTYMDKALQLSRTYSAVMTRAQLLRQENAA